MGKSKAGVDEIIFELELKEKAIDGRCFVKPIKSSVGRECGKIDVKEGKAYVSFCLPKFIRSDNVKPFSMEDKQYLKSIKKTLTYELQEFSDNINGRRLKSIEVNLTQKVAGVSTPDQILNMIHRSYTDRTNTVYEGPSRRCKYHKEKETVIVRVKNYYIIKCYNKTLEQHNAGNKDVESGLLRIEVIMQDRLIRRLFGQSYTLFDVLQECSLKKVIKEYSRILTNDLMKKHIIPCRDGIVNVLVESLMDTNSPSRTIYLHKEIIVDLEIMRTALKKWYDLWDKPDRSRQELYQLKAYFLPKDVLKTLYEFVDSCCKA